MLRYITAIRWCTCNTKRVNPTQAKEVVERTTQSSGRTHMCHFPPDYTIFGPHIGYVSIKAAASHNSQHRLCCAGPNTNISQPSTCFYLAPQAIHFQLGTPLSVCFGCFYSTETSNKAKFVTFALP
jgi:hypothetical protein